MQFEPDGPQLSFDFQQLPQQLLSVDEMWSALDEQKLRRWVEDSRFEVKSALIQPSHLGEYFSMWANTSPEGGIIVVGISKDNDFEGCLKVGTDKINALEKTGEAHCADAKYHVKQIRITRDRDGSPDFVIAFRVFYHETRVVRHANGSVFIRRGDSCIKLKTEDEIWSLKSDKGEISFEAEPCGIPYPQGFQMDTIRQFVASVCTHRSWNANKSPEEVLELRKLGKIKDGTFVPNIACALLFAKDPRDVAPGCRVRFLRFEGDSAKTGANWNAVKDVFIDGTIPEILHRAEEVLSSQLRTFSRLGTGGKFYTSPEYPQFAWYEAIVNAVAHRSYGNGMKNAPVFIRMFDDRLVVESPGGFGPLITPENIYDVHAPRNPFLMDAMYYMQYVKCAHEGTQRMRDEMKQMDLPAPEFKQEDLGHASVRVTLRNGINQRKVWVDRDVIQIVGAEVAHSLTDREKRCINFVAEHKETSVNEIVRLLGMEWGAAKNMLKRLTEKGILYHRHNGSGRDPRARYVLRSQEKNEN